MQDIGCLGLVQWDDPEVGGGMGREVGVGFRIGNTCTPVADSYWCMAKPIQYCKSKKKKKINDKVIYVLYIHSWCILFYSVTCKFHFLWFSLLIKYCLKVKVKSFSRVRFFATLWTAAHQAPPSVGLSRQEYWSGVPLPSPFGGKGFQNI